MATKLYKSVTGVKYIFPVTVSEVQYWVECGKFGTSNTGMQSAIEAHANFTSGKISLAGNYSTNFKSVSTIDVPGGGVLTGEISVPGAGYVAEEIITLDSTEKIVVRVLTIGDGGSVETFEIVEAGAGCTVNAIAEQLSTSGIGTGFKLKVLTITPNPEFPEVGVFKKTVFAEVTNINQAKEILRSDPYNVSHQKLKNPKAIIAQAIEHSVEFPNWII